MWIDRASETGEYPALFGAIGTEDGGYAHAQKYLAYCKEKNVKIYYEEMPGGHEWKVWDTMIVKYLDGYRHCSAKSSAVLPGKGPRKI